MLYKYWKFCNKFKKNYFCTTYLASFVIFCFLQFFSLFNFSSFSTIVFLIQSFISSNHCFLNFHLITSVDYEIYIFLNFTLSLCSTFHLLPLFLFHLNFHTNFYLFISASLPYSFQVVNDKKVKTLSPSPILFLFW